MKFHSLIKLRMFEATNKYGKQQEQILKIVIEEAMLFILKNKFSVMQNELLNC